MSITEVSKQLAENFSVRNLIRFLREKGFQTRNDGTLATRHWTAKEKETCHLDDLYARFSEPGLAGYTTFQATQTSFPVFFVELKEGTLAERSSRKLQFDYAKQILLFVSGTREYGLPSPCEHGIFVFSDNSRHVRMSLIEGIGKADSQKRFRRYTFYVDPEATNRTFIDRTSMDWSNFDKIKEAFSVERLSDEFFDEYKRIYQSFVEYATGKSMVKQGSKWVEVKTHEPVAEIMDQFAKFGDGEDDGEKAFRDYVKKMMGRLVFLQFLQKKGWLGVPDGGEWGDGDKNYLQSLFRSKSDEDKENFLDAVLELLFFDTLNTDRTKDGDIADAVLSLEQGKRIRIPYLNGGLFEKDELDKTTVKFPAQYFNDLFETFDRFNFTIDENDPEDAEIGVDPEMLGRIFENLLEDNKDKGAFYTPKEIVNYMCQESLIQYLGDSDEIRKLVTELDAEAVPETQREVLIEKLKAVKICDPAIGSGAFPMGMLNLLLHLRIKLGDVDDSSAGILHAKKEIIQNNIYGVDIEAGAVDIARLRFWLSIVVDEDTPTPLPNFDYKIMQGNSLLEQYHGVDLKLDLRPTDKKGKRINTALVDRQMCFAWDDEVKALENLKSAMDDFFDPAPGENKIAIRNNIDLAVKNYIKTKCGNDPQVNADIDAMDLNDKPFFLWHLYFADVFAQGGFDIVIGNPPYRLCEKSNTPVALLKAYQKFEVACYKIDLFHLFFEKGITLVKQNGILSYISSNTYMTNRHIKKLRNYIISATNIVSLLTYDESVFKSACVDVATILLKKSKKKNHEILLRRLCSKGYISLPSVKQDAWKNDPDKVFSMQLQMNFNLSDCTQLSNVCRSYFGIQAYDKDLSTSIKRENSNYLPIIDGSDFNRYTYATPHHFYDFRPSTIKSGGKKEVYEQERIVIRQIGKTPIIGLCKAGILASNTLYNIFLKDTKYDLFYVIGILNSRFMQFYWKMKYSDNKQLFPKIKGFQIDQLPIPKAKKDQQIPIICLVKTILQCKSEDINADISDLERQINGLVYRLYGLLPGEIDLIEKSFEETEKKMVVVENEAEQQEEPVDPDNENDGSQRS